MIASRLLRSLALPALFAAPLLVHAQVPNHSCDDPGTIKWCVPDTLVTVNINPLLDANLENAGFGDAASRAQCFQQAMVDWNAALSTVGAKLRLVYARNDNLWATDQNQPLCFDTEIPPPNLQAIYGDADLDNHQTDSKQTASTGHNNHAKLNAGAVNVLGPGWLVPSAGSGVSDTTMQVVPVDGVLAITTGHTKPANANCLAEADIVWYTHASRAGGAGGLCNRIRWDYRLAGAPAATRFDFYSVMLHELGHLLGLGHQADDGSHKNVMQSAISKGVRFQIGPKELNCLCLLYGDPGKDCSQVTGIHSSTWGRVKTLYR